MADTGKKARSRAESEQESDGSDFDQEQGIPQRQDPFLKQYLQGREALIEQEKSKRSDDAFRQSLTPLAIEACNIVSAILREEQDTIWKKSKEIKFNGSLGEGEEVQLFTGINFSMARDVLETTKTWQIIQRMPKGALLHHHMDAGMDIDFVIRTALDTPGMAMASDRPLISVQACKEATLRFGHQNRVETDGKAIWQDLYEPQTWVPLKSAAAAYDEIRGGHAEFIDWLKRKMTVPTDPAKQYRGIDDIWVHFANCFPPLQMLENYEPVFRAGFRKLLRDLRADGVQWADMRHLFLADMIIREGQDKAEPDCSLFFHIFDQEIKHFQETNEGADFWGCRFIWTSMRIWDKKKIVQHMRECVEMKKEYPHLICGYDLVGQEDAGRTLADLTPELFFFKKLCMENGVDIPFFFHAGECLGDGTTTDENLFDAILLGSRRIGHGYSLYKHPLLIDMVKSKSILIESCPISNEILRLNNTINAHPLPALLARNVPCSLSNDDPGVLGYGVSGVSHDFWQALQGWANVGLAGLGSLAENSVRWASFGPDVPFKQWKKDVNDGMQGQGRRAECMRQWRGQWDKFCEWIVMEHAVNYGGQQPL